MTADDNDKDVAERLLDAAAEEFLSAEYDVLGQVVLARIAERAGVPERSARRHFSADGLREQLVDHLLTVRPGRDLGPDEFAMLGAILTDREVPLAQALGDVVQVAYEHNLSNDLMRAQMVLWPYAKENSQIRERLIELYEFWGESAKDEINQLLVTHADVLRFRPEWISVDDFVRGMNALVEGLAIQQALYRFRASNDDAELTPPNPSLRPIDPRLAQKILLATFVSMIDRPGLISTEEALSDLEDERSSKDS